LPTSQVNNPNAVISTQRVLSSPPRKVFAAFEQPDRLAQWWGPIGFTNTFEQFDFKPGGRWVFVMHGPNGANYANESVFREIQPDTRIVIEHVVKPWYRLTVTRTARGDQTHLPWDPEFESPEVAAKFRPFRPLSATANEQNLNRLQSLLASENYWSRRSPINARRATPSISAQERRKSSNGVLLPRLCCSGIAFTLR